MKTQRQADIVSGVWGWWGFTCVVLIALSGFTVELSNSRAHGFSAGAQILRALLQLNTHTCHKTVLQEPHVSILESMLAQA